MCIISGCLGKNHGKIYCWKHYFRFKKYNNAEFCKYEHGLKCSFDKCNNEYHAKGYCKIHYDKFNKNKTLHAQALFLIILEHYGKNCNCCKENNIKLLTVDHINNDGAEHRRKFKNNLIKIYQDIIDNNFPIYYQILCHNCNWGRAMYGECPHKLK